MRYRSVPSVVILSIITCGFYFLFWVAMVSDEISAQLPEDPRTKTGGSVILFTILTCGIYMFYWLYVQGEKLDKLKTKANIPTNNSSSIIYLILALAQFSIISVALIQNDINNLVNSNNGSNY